MRLVDRLTSSRSPRLMYAGILIASMIILNACEQQESRLDLVPIEQQAGARLWLQDLPQYSRDYDPSRDAFKDLVTAKADAKAAGKSVFMVVGGDWCSWCHVMTRFFSREAPVRARLLGKFVLLKINMSEANENRDFLDDFPEIRGYPHIFILDASGKVLDSRDSSFLQDGADFSVTKFERFLRRL